MCRENDCVIKLRSGDIYIYARLHIPYTNNNKRGFYTILFIDSTHRRLSPLHKANAINIHIFIDTFIDNNR